MTSNLARFTFVRRIKAVSWRRLACMETCARITTVDHSDVIHADSLNPVVVAVLCATSVWRAKIPHISPPTWFMRSIYASNCVSQFTKCSIISNKVHSDVLARWLSRYSDWDTGWTVRRSNPDGDEIFRPSVPALEPTQLPVKWVPGLSRGVKCGRGVLLTTHPLLGPRSWKSRAIPLPTLWATPGL